MIIKITPDKEKASSLFQMAESKEDFVNKTMKLSSPNILAENYYEIIKELSTAIALIDGFKAVGENAHKEIIDFMSNYKLEQSEIELINDLRIKRNKSLYEGKQIDSSYIENKQHDILKVIQRLKSVLKDKL